MKKLLKSNTEGLLFVKENTEKKVLHEILIEEFLPTQDGGQNGPLPVFSF